MQLFKLCHFLDSHYMPSLCTIFLFFVSFLKVKSNVGRKPAVISRMQHVRTAIKITACILAPFNLPSLHQVNLVNHCTGISIGHSSPRGMARSSLGKGTCGTFDSPSISPLCNSPESPPKHFHLPKGVDSPAAAPSSSSLGNTSRPYNGLLGIRSWDLQW